MPNVPASATSSTRPPRLASRSWPAALRLRLCLTVLAGGRTVVAQEPPPAAPLPTYVIDLPTALVLAERKNPTIAISREAVFANLALLQQARAQLLPTLVAGGNLHVHRGALQRDTGQMINVNEQSLYVGGGAGAIGAGTVAIPAIRIYAPLSNALFEPLVAQQGVAVSRFDARATSNTVLLDVVLRYFDLMGAEASREAFWRSDADATQVAATVEAYVKVGQARKADADRAVSRTLLVRNLVYHADENVGVAAARLARLLDLDPSIRLQTVPGPVQPINVVDPSYDLAALIGIALRCRPEMAARNSAIAPDARPAGRKNAGVPGCRRSRPVIVRGSLAAAATWPLRRPLRTPAATTSTCGRFGPCRTRAWEIGPCSEGGRRRSIRRKANGSRPWIRFKAKWPMPAAFRQPAAARWSSLSGSLSQPRPAFVKNSRGRGAAWGYLSKSSIAWIC